MNALDRLVVVFDALSDPTRLRILNLMRDGEVCVCFFVEILDEAQSKISRHLAYLRRAGLVHARRDGRWMHYGLAPQKDDAVRRVIDETLSALATQPTMARDASRMVKVCCGASLPKSLRGAPIPAVASGR
jgi:ArsR family transcriptional regulator